MYWAYIFAYLHTSKENDAKLRPTAECLDQNNEFIYLKQTKRKGNENNEG